MMFVSKPALACCRLILNVDCRGERSSSNFEPDPMRPGVRAIGFPICYREASAGCDVNINLRIVFVVAACVLLTACADIKWDSAYSVVDAFGDADDADLPHAPEAARPAAVASVQAGTAETFCKGFADTQSWKAQQLGASLSEQRHAFERSYEDCMMRSSSWIN